MHKKKILITGLNKLQCTRDFYLNQQLQVVPSHYSLIRCLEDMGYEVEQRVVEIGENLDEYFDIIVFLHNPSGFAAFVYNALWAIYSRPDCILAFDDWQTDSIYNGLLALKDPEKLFRKYVLDSHEQIPENIVHYQDQFVQAIDKVESKTNRMLISAFSGGDLKLVVDYPDDKLFGYNPNPYHLHRKAKKGGVMSFEEPVKERVFNFAGLVQDKTSRWLKKQGVDQTNWELKLYGSRKDGQDRVKEGDMVHLFNRHWGILMAGYHHAGSGWWRSRYTQVADAGSILISAPEDLYVVYKDWELSSFTALDLVDKTDEQLVEIAAAQKAAVFKNHPLDKEIQKSELDRVIQRRI